MSDAQKDDLRRRVIIEANEVPDGSSVKALSDAGLRRAIKRGKAFVAAAEAELSSRKKGAA